MQWIYLICFILLSAGLLALFGVKPDDFIDALFRSQRKSATLSDELNVLLGTPAKGFFNQDYELKQILKGTGRADRYEAIKRLSLILFAVGAVLALLIGNVYMVPILGIGFSLMQEMVIWSMLNWRILRWDDIAQEYEKLATASGYCTERSLEDCTNRLLTRGLLVSGSGETEYDALYDLLGSLSIIPTSGPFFLRLASFVKLTLLAHVPVSAARKLFQKDKRTKYEVLVMRLAGQALLSTAEIIKCIDKNISRLPNECALLDSLYGDETTTSDNIASMVKISQSSKPVTLAVANLYLRQQIIFERV